MTGQNEIESGDKEHRVDDLQYDWPANVLSYETRFMFGLTVNDLLVVGIVGMVLLMVNIVLGLAAIVVGLLLVRRYEALGERRPPEYAFAWLRHRLSRRPVTLPHVLPSGSDDEIIITDLDGKEIARMGGNT